MDAHEPDVIQPTAIPPPQYKPLPSGRWVRIEYLPPPPQPRVRTMEQRLEELTRHLCSIREVATQLARLQWAWDDHGPSLAQWRLFASRLGELFAQLELPLQLRDDVPVTDPASDPATGLPPNRHTGAGTEWLGHFGQLSTTGWSLGGS